MVPNIDIPSMSSTERLALIADLWDSLDPGDVPLTEPKREELDRRLDDLESNPTLGISGEEAIGKLRARRR